MELGIQFGHGMQAHAENLLKRWGSGSTILSPRNFQNQRGATSQDRLVTYAEKISKYSTSLLVDPQLYSMGSPSKNLRNYPYWKACNENLIVNREVVISELSELNRMCETTATIVPSTTAQKIDDNWAEAQNLLIEEAARYRSGSDLIATIALGSDVLKSDAMVDRIVAEASSWEAEAIYLVCEHPDKAYLVSEPLWLLNLMNLVAALKLSGKRVYVGYASHQMLLLALAKCDGIFSGNFLNVRRFETSTFESCDDGPGRRATWYYVPQALSEFKLPTLDLAYQGGFLDVLRSPFNSEYSDVLFQGSMPTETAYREGNSFLHYLHSIHEQCAQFNLDSYRDTYNAYWFSLQTAERMIDGLRQRGIYDRDRNFADASQANYQAVAAFNSNMGNQMEWEWNSL